MPKKNNKDANPWLGFRDVMALLHISRSQAYRIIAELNAELRQKGYLTMNGRVSRRYFNERYYG